MEWSVNGKPFISAILQPGCPCLSVEVLDKFKNVALKPYPPPPIVD